MLQKLLFALFAVAALAAAGYIVLYPAVRQPAAYNHQKHLDLNMPCVACHNGALTATHATLPRTAICMNCHAGSKEEVFKPIQAFAKDGGEIPWARVTRLPGHVFFSHRRHTTIGQLRCQACHGPIEKQTTALVRPLLTVSMGECIDCHRKLHAATDCNSCHR